MSQSPTEARPEPFLEDRSTDSAGQRPAAIILVEDLVTRRLIEAASAQLGLDALTFGSFDEIRSLGAIDLIIADESVSRDILTRRHTAGSPPELVRPSLIAVRDRTLSLPAQEPEFDGLLTVPQELGPLSAQLGLFLYAHRAFARRVHSAMEELQLNRRIFASVTSGISVATAAEPDLPLVYVNPAFEVMTGYSLEEVQGKNCRFLQNGERDQPGLTLLREAIQTKREVVAILKNYRKDGSSFWNELSLSPIRNRLGELTHFVGIQSDVTARVEFEAALRESEKLAAVGRLAASIAHEINNPLEAVTNLLYLAQHSSDAEETHAYLAHAEKELARVSLITSQSLRFYRQSTRPQAVRCSEILDSVLDIYGTRLTNTGVSVERRERMTESIVCLESEIRQVLSNLIRNAIDAMQSTGGRLLLRSREATAGRSDTRGALITVADTGTGISRETMKHLYTAFFSTKGIGGTGLGLWVSAEIIKRHRGRLIVRSRERRDHIAHGWTVFELFLPYQGLAS